MALDRLRFIMNFARACFWIAACLVAYSYIIYPLLLGLLARLRGKPAVRGPAARHSVTIITTAFNEETAIERRLSDLTNLLSASGVHGEIVVVSDGSTDGTTERARRFAGPLLRVLELPRNVGKAAALNEGWKAARHEILVFADIRQRWASDALERLIESFSDPTIGAVGGELVIESSPGVMAGVGIYWRLEKWLRRQESRVHSTVGVSGSIAAVRWELFQRIPEGTILDDVYWPLCVVMQGFRVVHDERAKAFDQLPERARDELRRKVRTLSGNFQLIAQCPRLLSPWHNPVWFQLVSHKLSRLAVPWALLVMLIASALVDSVIYRAVFWSQIFMYLIAIAGIRREIGSRLRIASVASSFLILNAAAWIAFWVWISGRAPRSWNKVAYGVAPVAPSDPSNCVAGGAATSS
jgi:glycosyltransferase involved in cell wall biosynthesis